MIQVQERQDGGIVALSRKTDGQVAEVEFSVERASDQAMRPVVEVAQDDARTGDIDCPKQILIHQAHGLSPTLPLRGPQMQVEDVQQALVHADVGAQSAAPLASRDSQVDGL